MTGEGKVVFILYSRASTRACARTGRRHARQGYAARNRFSSATTTVTQNADGTSAKPMS